MVCLLHALKSTLLLIIKNNIGAGNSVFPLLASNKNPQLSLYAFDYASHAVKLVQVPRILLLLSALKLIHKGFIV